MSDHVKKDQALSTRDAVETAIDLSKRSKSASWDELVNDKHEHQLTDPEAAPSTALPPPACRA